jgi:RHS repeat-associated protein
MGDLIGSTDDSQVFFDRSLGVVAMGNPSNATGIGPNQLISATLSSSTSGNSGGAWATYDDAGNLVQLQVERKGSCTAGAGCNQLFQYDWDEVGNLARARRFDFAGGETCVTSKYLHLCTLNPEPTNFAYPALPTTSPSADVSYAYDAGGTRVLRASTPDGEATTYSAEIFPSLRLNHAQWLGTSYEDTVDTESVYLTLGSAAFGRVVYNPDAPNIAGALHVYLELTDSLGSASIVIDKDTSELVERTTYLAYGALDSDYRPDRWQDFREDYKFTGKEGDVEVGLTYFGARYYSPSLGRWISTDPLSIHEMGGDLNPYAYVRGRVTVATDPDGRDDDSDDDGVADFSDPGVPLDQYSVFIPADTVAGLSLDATMVPIAQTPENFNEYMIGPGGTGGSGQPTLAQMLTNVGIGSSAFLYGALQGVVPGGVLASVLPLPDGAQTPLFQYWMGAGQMSGGLIGAIGGLGGGALGILGAGPSGGASLATLSASAAAVANGITAIGAGWTNLQMGAAGAGKSDTSGQPPEVKGTDASQAEKQAVRQENRDAHGGQLTCENCGRDDLVDPQRARGGVPRPENEAQVDHIVTKAQGGQGARPNLRVLCPACNAPGAIPR